MRTRLTLCICLALTPIGASLATAQERAHAQAQPADEHTPIPHNAMQAAGHEVQVASGEQSKHAEGAGAEGHEEGPVISNWWDWGKRNPPPFGFALVNFLAFATLLYLAAGKSFREFLQSRHHEVSRELDEAAAVRRKAEEQLTRYEDKIRGLETAVADMLSTVRREAEAEQDRIIAAAAEQAARLKRDAEAQIQNEILRARADLQRTVVLAALQAAEALLKTNTQEADQKRLVEDYVSRVEALTPAQRRTAR